MSLKIYRQDLKVTGEGLVTFNFEVENLKVEEVINSLFKKSWIVIWHFRVYSIFLENSNTPIQSDLMISFNKGWQELGNSVSINFADIAIYSRE